MPLEDELERARQAEQVKQWDAGEGRLAAGLSIQQPRIELTSDVLTRFDRFSKWCAVKQVRRLPAKPKTVAAFVLEQDALGVPAQQIISILNAIELSHDRHSLSNPMATAIVRAALGQVVKIEPPGRGVRRRKWSGRSCRPMFGAQLRNVKMIAIEN